jgi:uncharacterized protein (DUF2062 family)
MGKENPNKDKPKFFKSLQFKLIGFIKRGTSPKELSIAITLGFLIGIMPFVGATTILSTIIALRWKLNLPIILGVTYVVFPLQLILLYPYYKLAAFVFKVQYLLPSTANILIKLRQDWVATLSGIGIVTVYALLVWLVTSLLSGWFIYKTITLVTKRYRK